MEIIWTKIDSRNDSTQQPSNKTQIHLFIRSFIIKIVTTLIQ